jgi:hypothetical protein
MRTTNGIAWVGLWPMGQAAASTRGRVPVRMWQGRAKSRFRCCRVRQVRRRMLWDPWGRLAKAWKRTRLVLLELDEQLRLHLLVPRRIERPLHKPNGLARQQPVTCHHAPCTMPHATNIGHGRLSSESPPFPQTRVAATRRNGCELCRPLFGTLPAFSAHSPARPRNKVNLPSGSHVSPAESRSVQARQYLRFFVGCSVGRESSQYAKHADALKPILLRLCSLPESSRVLNSATEVKSRWQSNTPGEGGARSIILAAVVETRHARLPRCCWQKNASRSLATRARNGLHRTERAP